MTHDVGRAPWHHALDVDAELLLVGALQHKTMNNQYQQPLQINNKNNKKSITTIIKNQ